MGKLLFLSLMEKIKTFKYKSRYQKLMFARNFLAFIMLGVILVNTMDLHRRDTYAEGATDSSSNYSVSIAWRDENGEWYDGDTEQQNSKKLVYTGEEHSNKELNIVMNIQIKNTNLNPVLYPGEIRIKLNNLDGLKRNISDYTFEMNDPIFSSVWKAEYNESDGTYTLVNIKPITDKAANTTLHWTVAARDAVGYIEEEDDNNDGTAPYTRTIEAEYSIVRYLRDEDGNFLAFNDGSNFILEGNDTTGYLIKDENGNYVSDYVDETNYSVVEDNKIKVINNSLVTDLNLADGVDVYEGTEDDTFIVGGNQRLAVLINGTYRYVSAYTYEGSDDIIYIDSNGMLVDEDGNCLDQTTVTVKKENGDTVDVTYPVFLDDSAYQTGIPKEATEADYKADVTPTTLVDTHDTPEATNSIDFYYETKADVFTQNITANANSDIFDPLPDGYWYNRYTVNVLQKEYTRGLAESDYFVGIPLSSLSNLSEEDFTNGNIVVYDTNNTKKPLEKITVTVKDEDTGEYKEEVYYGYYVHQSKLGDLNNDKAETSFTIGLKEDKINEEPKTRKVFNVDGVFTPFYNDESKPRDPMVVEQAVTIDPTATASDASDPSSITPSVDRDIKPDDISLSKSSGFEQGNHEKPNDPNKLMLTGLLFQGGNIAFNIYPGVNKSPTVPVSNSIEDEEIKLFAAEPYFENDLNVALADPYDLYVGDDALSVRYTQKVKIEGTEDDYEEIEKYFLLNSEDYDISTVTIPKGIYKYNDSGEKQGFNYKLYTGTRTGNTVSWSPTPASTGTTSPDSDITLSVNADTFYIVIENVDVVIKNKGFRVNIVTHLDSQKADYAWFLGADPKFGDSNARVVNYAFSQLLYDSNNDSTKDSDLAAKSSEPTLDSPYGFSNINALLDNEDDQFLNDPTGGNSYLNRVYSNAYLRTALATITSTTRYSYPTYVKPGITSAIDDDAWFNRATTTGTIISENPGKLNTFSLHVQLPENTQLVFDDANLRTLLTLGESDLTAEQKTAGEEAYAKLMFDEAAASRLMESIVFSATDYYSAVDPAQTPIKLTAANLNTYNTKISYDTETRLLSVSFRFDLQNTPLYEAELTSVSFTYGLLHTEEKAYNDSKVPIISYTVLSDLGQDIKVGQGTTSTDTSDLDKNSITNQTIAKSDSTANLKFLDQYRTLNNRKFVKTEYSGGRYVTSSRVMAMPNTIEEGAEVPASAKYNYRLEVYKAHDGNQTDNLSDLIVYDQIEQYHPNGEGAASENSQWQGTFKYIGVGSEDSNIADYGLEPYFFYRTVNTTWGNNYVTPEGAATPNEAFSDNLRVLSGYITETDGYENDGWKKGHIDADGKCTTIGGEEPKAVALYLKPGAESKISTATTFYVTMYMEAPVGTTSNINTRAVNRFFVEDMDPTLSKGGGSLQDSDVVKVLLMNTVKIRKVDYDDNSMVLSAYEDKDGNIHGAEFSVYKYTGSTSPLPSELNDTYPWASYQADNGTSYETKYLHEACVNFHGELELPVPAGNYLIREAKAPENYDQDPYVYLVNFDDAGRAKILAEYTMGDSGHIVASNDAHSSIFSGVTKVEAVDDQKRVATIGEENTIISVRDKSSVKGSIFFKKTDKDTGKPLEGVKFELYKADLSEDFAELTGDELEAAIASSYSKVDLDHSIDDDDPGFILDYGYYYHEGETGDVLQTNSDGEMMIRDLPPGYYAIKEIEGKVGYQTDNKYYPFQIRFATTKTVETTDSSYATLDKYNIQPEERFWYTSSETTDEESGEAVTVYNYEYGIANSQIRSSIRVHKMDKENGSGLKNARYSLYKFDKGDSEDATAQNTVAAFIRDKSSPYWELCSGEKITPTSGVVYFNDLVFGEYIVVENSAPVGYARSDNFTPSPVNSTWYSSSGIISITPELAASHYDAETGEFSPLKLDQEDERKTGKLSIVKQDAQDTSKGINGAQFKVFKPTDETNADYNALKETDETLVEGVKDEDGRPTYKVSASGAANKAILAYDSTVSAYRRYEELEGESGAVFLTERNTTLNVDGYTAEITGLPWGVTYLVYELTPPKGYEAAAPQFVPLTKNDVDNTLYVYVDDNRQRGKVTLTKTGEDGATQEDAKFELYFKPEGQSEYTKCSVTWDTRGEYAYADSGGTTSTLQVTAGSENTLQVTNLPWGAYYFKEIQAPTGYGMSADIAFSVSQNSCGVDQQLRCVNQKAKAKIIIDKEIDVDPALYANAFGYPTFIFKIEEVADLTGTPKADGKTYNAFINFDTAGEVRKSISVDVEQGIYKVSEVRVARYTLENTQVLTPTEGETNIDASKYSLVSNIGYCNLIHLSEGSEDTFLPTFEMEFNNKLSRYDELSHTGNANNLFPSKDYITGFSVSYDTIIPVNDAGNSTTSIDKTALSGTWIYASGEEVPMTDAEKAKLVITTASGGVTVTNGAVGDATFTIPNTIDLSASSSMVTVSVNKANFTEKTDLASDMAYTMPINYGAYKPDRLVRVKLLPDLEGYINIKLDGLLVGNAELTLKQPYDNGTSSYYSSNLSYVNGAGLHKYTDYTYEGGEDPDTKNRYVFDHWYLLDENNNPVRKTGSDGEAARFTGVDGYSDTEVGAIIPFTSEAEILAYVKINPGSKFKFRCEAIENPVPTAMLIPAFIGNNFDNSKKILLWNTTRTTEDYKELVGNTYNSSKWNVNNNYYNVFKNATAITAVYNEADFKTAFENESNQIYDISVRFNNDRSSASVSYNTNETYRSPIFAWMDGTEMKIYTPSKGGIYLSDGSDINSCAYFYRFNSLADISALSNWDAAKSTTLASLFEFENYSYSKITNTDAIAGWNVDNVTNLKHTFMNCGRLQSLNLSNWNLSKVTNMDQTFIHMGRSLSTGSVTLTISEDSQIGKTSDVFISTGNDGSYQLFSKCRISRDSLKSFVEKWDCSRLKGKRIIIQNSNTWENSGNIDFTDINGETYYIKGRTGTGDNTNGIVYKSS